MKINEFTLVENQKIEDMSEFDLSTVVRDLEIVQKGDIKTGVPFDLTIEFDKNCKLKGARAFQILSKLDDISKIIKADPSRKDIEDEKSFSNLKVLIISNEDEKEITNEIKKVDEVSSVRVEKLAGKTQKFVEEKGTLIQEETQTIRIPLTALNEMMSTLGEIIIERNNAEKELQKNYDQDYSFGNFDRITNELQNLILKARLVPLENIFNFYPRLVRKLAKESNKNIDLIIEGENVKIDRISLDVINETLIQILRNSIDHGIESSKDRKKMNKAEAGKIVIKAKREYQDIIITIEDDGKGIDIPSLKKNAFNKKIVEQNDKLTKENLISLLFQSGFSTKEKVSTLSGKGNGLYSVYTNVVDKLRGKIDVLTTKDVGTRFTMRIGVSFLILDVLVVEMKKTFFTIPLVNVRKVISVPKDKFYFDTQSKPYIVLNKEIIPVVSIRNNNKMEPMSQSDLEINTKGLVVIWEQVENKLAFLIDKIITQQQIVYKPMDSLMSKINGFNGFSFIGEGNVAPIINPLNYENILTN
jgi:two-component system chemotaxis sensor kinase CheA